jgi:hypothetical protein
MRSMTWRAISTGPYQTVTVAEIVKRRVAGRAAGRILLDTYTS